MRVSLQKKMNKKVFQKDLLDWYDHNQRILPWRDNKNPYYIWISEIMLQQTKVQTVIPYFERFIRTLPTIQALANAEEDALLKLWEGLGYYNRVKNLQVAAKEVVHNFNGVLPNNKEDLETLKGIGPYTSGAIASIAFNKKHSAVDGNVLRVFARLLEIKGDIKEPKNKKRIKEYVETLLPSRVGDFNQGLMEIGATVCVPNGQPLCALCPFNSYCKAYLNNTTKEIPEKRKKKKRPIELKTVLVLKHNNRYAIEKRNDQGLLASMYQFPMFNGHLSIEEIIGFELGTIEKVSNLEINTHKFTHKEWNMQGYLIELSKDNTSYLYETYQNIDKNYTVPSAFSVYKKLIEVELDE